MKGLRNKNIHLMRYSLIQDMTPGKKFEYVISYEMTVLGLLLLKMTASHFYGDLDLAFIFPWEMRM